MATDEDFVIDVDNGPGAQERQTLAEYIASDGEWLTASDIDAVRQLTVGECVTLGDETRGGLRVTRVA